MLLGSAALVASACGGEPSAELDAGGGVDATAELDAAAVDAAPVDTGLPPVDAPVAPPDAPGTASLVGVVTRSGTGAFEDPPPDGRGDLYLFVYENDPSRTSPAPVLVTSVVVRDVDLSTPERSVPYAMYGIPPRAEPYWIAAFLDDDGNASPSDPRPDVDDTAVMSGTSVPTTTIDTEGEHVFDVDLNFVLFFSA